jgi:hypothetical protein
MKKSVPLIPVLLCIMLIFNSFSTINPPLVQGKNNFGDPKEDPAVCFVQMKDGTVRNYTSLKLVTGVLITPHLLADDKIKIYPGEIKAYQNKDHYAVSQVTFASGRRTYVAVETLPGFAVRIARGKVNLYSKKFYNGTSSIDEFFIQSGDDGQIFAYTPALMKELAKDSPETLNFFNSKTKHSSLPEKLQATLAMLNNANMVSKN